MASRVEPDDTSASASSASAVQNNPPSFSELIQTYESDLRRLLAELRTLNEKTDKTSHDHAKFIDESIDRLDRNLNRLRSLPSTVPHSLSVPSNPSILSFGSAFAVWCIELSPVIQFDRGAK